MVKLIIKKMGLLLYQAILLVEHQLPQMLVMMILIAVWALIIPVLLLIMFKKRLKH